VLSESYDMGRHIHAQPTGERPVHAAARGASRSREVLGPRLLALKVFSHPFTGGKVDTK
jgi:hypothetical protein